MVDVFAFVLACDDEIVLIFGFPGTVPLWLRLIEERDDAAKFGVACFRNVVFFCGFCWIVCMDEVLG